MSEVIDLDDERYDLLEWREKRDKDVKERTLRNANEFLEKKGEDLDLDLEFERNYVAPIRRIELFLCNN